MSVQHQDAVHNPHRYCIYLYVYDTNIHKYIYINIYTHTYIYIYIYGRVTSRLQWLHKLVTTAKESCHGNIYGAYEMRPLDVAQTQVDHVKVESCHTYERVVSRI